MMFERDALSQHVEELVHGLALTPVAEQLLLADLAVPLVDDSELELVDQHVLVVGQQQFGRRRRQHRLQPLQGQLVIQQLPIGGQEVSRTRRLTAGRRRRTRQSSVFGCSLQLDKCYHTDLYGDTFGWSKPI